MTRINGKNIFIENGILKQCKLDSELYISGCNKVCGDMEEKDRNNPAIISDGVFYESLNHNSVLRRIFIDAEIIGMKCFEWATALENVELKNTRKIEGMAFWGCTSLRKMTIPASVSYIEGDAFGCCGGVTLTFEGGWEQAERITNGEGEKYFGNDVKINIEKLSD